METAVLENNSIQAISAYVREGLDPAGVLSRHDDAENAVAQFNEIFAEDGGCALSVEQMQRYLDSLSD